MIDRLQSSLATFPGVNLPKNLPAKRSSSRLVYATFGFLLLCTPSLFADDRAVVHRVPPVYPEMAKRMHISGTVRVLTTVDATGTVTKVEGQGSNKILSGAAEDAVKHWKFAAGDGIATVTVQINFDE